MKHSAIKTIFFLRLSPERITKMKINLNILPGILIIIFCLSCQAPQQDLFSEQNILKNISEPEIPDFKIKVIDYGAKADSITNCKPAIDKAISIIKENGGGILIFPAGNYRVNGPIHLVSNMALHLEEGAHLRFGSNPADYLPVVETSWEGTFLYNYSPFIYAKDAQNISIIGKGTIDGEASETWHHWKAKQKTDQLLSREMNRKHIAVEERIFGDGHFLRPQLIQFFDCKNIKVEGITIEDSPFWCLHLLQCENVIIRDVYYNAFNYNNDGIDVEYSRNVLIKNVHFNNSDDNIAIKAGRDDDGRSSSARSENIIVRNCFFKGLHALVVGSEMSAGVQNVFINDCSFAGKLKRGIYLKSNPDRGGFIRNIFVKNIRFGEVEDCIYMTSFYHNEGKGHATEIKDIRLENIECQTATGTAIVLQGYPEMKIRDIYFENVKIDSAENALSMTATENIIMSDVVIGKLATAPSYVQ